jgi:hypothetical protein
VTWFKIDDAFWAHPKTMALSTEAIALWVRAGSWSCQQLTDGIIPDRSLPLFSASSLAVAELVEVGFWIEIEGGHEYHDWDEYQETSEVVKARRAKARERMRSVRANKERTEGERAGELRAQFAKSSLNPDPTRPDPTEGSKEPSSSKRKKPEIALPSSWSPTPSHFDRATKDGLDIAKQVERFRNHAEAHDRRAANWNAAFTMWLSKAQPEPSAARTYNRDAWMQER